MLECIRARDYYIFEYVVTSLSLIISSNKKSARLGYSGIFRIFLGMT